jgi:hypothetical protein
VLDGDKLLKIINKIKIGKNCLVSAEKAYRGVVPKPPISVGGAGIKQRNLFIVQRYKNQNNLMGYRNNIPWAEIGPPPR